VENRGMSAKPLVSIGLMVYNGGRFLRGTLDSLLSQTFTNFELIISDNCSTDDTPAICVEYAGRDSRIRYYRAERNMGAGWNTRKVLSLATAKYFKLAAHDDRCEPRFLERCVEALERDPFLVLAYPKARVVDEDGIFVENYDWPLRTSSPDPKIRYHDLLLNDHLCLQFFGVIRLAALRKLPPPGSYVNSDGVILAQLGLLGAFCEVPEILFISTRHGGQSSKTPPTRVKVKGFRLTRRHGTLPCPEWWDPSTAKAITFPEWRQLREYFLSVGYGDLSFSQRLRCYLMLLPWIKKHFRRMMKDLVIAADQLLYNLQASKSVSKKASATAVSSISIGPTASEE
jgi:glycosyltransferase involved in cell wall biosynthesis